MTDAARRRPGGRTARVREAVLKAAIAELVEHGHGAVRLDAIANRAGVNKATLYRRWGGRDGVVLAAVEWYGVAQADVPDTENLDNDLRGWARSIAEMLADPASLALVLAVFTGDPTTTRPLRQRFWQSRLERVRPLIERAMIRSELPPDTDVDEMIRQLGAPLYYRAVVLLEPVTEADADRTAAITATAARAGLLRLGPPAADRHSFGLRGTS